MTTKTVLLPNGIITESGEIIRELDIRQLDGHDEDLIRDKANMREGNVIEKLLKRCITRIGDETDADKIAKLYDNGLLLADTTFLLVNLRMHGIDSVYRFQHTCRCEYHSTQVIDLAALDVTEQQEAYRGRKEIPLEVEDKIIIIRPLYARDSKLLEQLKRQYPKERGTRELLVQVKSVDGVDKVTAPIIKSWTWRFRNALRNAIDTTTGGIETQLIITCPNCEYVVETAMPVDVRDFFFPKAASSASSETIARPCRGFGMTWGSSEQDGTGGQTTSAVFQ